MNFLEELLGLVDALDRAGIDYALCGAVAVAIHGYPRFTKDIDLLVREADLDQAREAARSRGFGLEGGLIRFGSGTPAEMALFRVSKAQGAELLTLDLMMVGPVLEEIWRTRQIVEWRGRRLAVVSRQGLAAMKRRAGRSQDLLDLEKLGEPRAEDDESG